VPLTGYKLYAIDEADLTTLVYDGTDLPDVIQTQISDLDLDADYSFYLTGLNPFEGAQSDRSTYRAGGRPDAPG